MGNPLFTYGRSKGYSWGCTALNPDNTDLYVEKVNGTKFFFDGEWHDFRVVKETIKVRGGKEVTHEIRFTKNGVMMFKPKKDEFGYTLWFPLEFLNQNNDLDYSMRWIYDEPLPPLTVYTASKELFNKEPTLEGIEHFMESQTMFPLNMNFITAKGDIGYHMTGMFPVRKYNVGHGVYPKKGWLKENQWLGVVSPKEHPRLYNPDQGFIVSANNFVASKNCKHGISHAFSFSHRFVQLTERYQKMIKTKGKLNIQDMIDAQLDVIDYQALHSTKYIMSNVERGLDSALNLTYRTKAERESMRSYILRAFNDWKSWDFGFRLNQT